MVGQVIGVFSTVVLVSESHPLNIYPVFVGWVVGVVAYDPECMIWGGMFPDHPLRLKMTVCSMTVGGMGIQAVL